MGLGGGVWGCRELGGDVALGQVFAYFEGHGSPFHVGLNIPQAAPLVPDVSATMYYFDVSGMLQLVTAQYAGSAPTLLCGITQINFQVPLEIAPGAFSFAPAVNQNGTVEALTSVTIAVKRTASTVGEAIGLAGGVGGLS